VFKDFTDANIYMSEIIRPYKLLKRQRFIILSVRKVSILATLACCCANPVIVPDSNIALDYLVVTSTRSDTALLDLAGNTGTIPEQEIDLVGADHFTEVIKRVLGVMIQHGNGQEQLTSLRSSVC
jgi:outer membrane cobalamin receptor